jgi:hypothetical protein
MTRGKFKPRFWLAPAVVAHNRVRRIAAVGVVAVGAVSLVLAIGVSAANATVVVGAAPTQPIRPTPRLDRRRSRSCPPPAPRRRPRIRSPTQSHPRRAAAAGSWRVITAIAGRLAPAGGSTNAPTRSTPPITPVQVAEPATPSARRATSGSRTSRTTSTGTARTPCSTGRTTTTSSGTPRPTTRPDRDLGVVGRAHGAVVFAGAVPLPVRAPSAVRATRNRRCAARQTARSQCTAKSGHDRSTPTKRRSLTWATLRSRPIAANAVIRRPRSRPESGRLPNLRAR